MSTVEQTAQDGQGVTTPSAVNAAADGHLAAVDDLMRRLQMATTSYRSRALDWGDIASLRWMQEHLSAVLRGFSTAEAAAELSRATRTVASEVRNLR